MNRVKPFELLAVRYGISRESAKYFLIRVQKSFRTDKPPHQLILKFMEEQGFESLPQPYHVAKLMNEAGHWAYPLNTEPLRQPDEEDLYAE